MRQLRFLLLLAPCFLAGCDAGFQTMGSSEHGVIFSALPPFMGGGVSDTIIQPTVKVFVLPWEKLYRLDTSLRTVGWGGQERAGSNAEGSDYVETRALDGNEVGLAMTVQYRVIPERIPYVIQRVGVDDERIRNLVATVARADIRTHMNVLRTQDFFKPELRQKAVDQMKDALESRLSKEGIEIDSVVYVNHRFERRIVEGSEVTVDRRYQEQIDQTQALNQQEQQEQKRIATVSQEKNAQLNDAQAKANRRLQEAEGVKRQAVLRGDGYLEAKRNEAEQITALGMAEVEGLKKQIAALSGPGGRALLRLSVARALVARNPKFVVLNSAAGEKGIDLSRTDTNELIRELGIFAVANDSAGRKTASTGSATSGSVVEVPLDPKNATLGASTGP